MAQLPQAIPSAATASRLGFLDLPGEVRNAIYGYASILGDVTPFLQVCRMVSVELGSIVLPPPVVDSLHILLDPVEGSGCWLTFYANKLQKNEAGETIEDVWHWAVRDMRSPLLNCINAELDTANISIHLYPPTRQSEYHRAFKVLWPKLTDTIRLLERVAERREMVSLEVYFRGHRWIERKFWEYHPHDHHRFVPTYERGLVPDVYGALLVPLSDCISGPNWYRSRCELFEPRGPNTVRHVRARFALDGTGNWLGLLFTEGRWDPLLGSTFASLARQKMSLPFRTLLPAPPS